MTIERQSSASAIADVIGELMAERDRYRQLAEKLVEAIEEFALHATAGSWSAVLQFALAKAQLNEALAEARSLLEGKE